MKQNKDLEALSVEEMVEHSKNISRKRQTKPTDLAVRFALVLLLPYIIWLSQYDDAYVSSIQGHVMHFNLDGILNAFHNLINSANMIVHESGHGVCYLLPCPQFFTSLNGTLFQLALPLFFSYYYFKRHNKMLVAVGGVWLAQNLVYVAWYMSYSQTPERYPFFLGGAATHDFWYIFSQLGVLEYDTVIAGFVRVVAVILLWFSYGYLLRLAFLSTDNTNCRSKRKSRIKRIK